MTEWIQNIVVQKNRFLQCCSLTDSNAIETTGFHSELRKISACLERMGVRKFIGTAKIRVQYLKAVRDWKSWLHGSTSLVRF